MMLPTHIIISLFLLLPLSIIYPSYSTQIFIFGLIGSIFPDLDMIRLKHRKTLHPIIIYLILTLLFVTIFLITNNSTLGLVAITLSQSFVHTFVDIFGTGAEKYPWEQNNPDVVYSFVLGRWINARRYIPYDGSFQDLILLILLSTVFLYYNNNEVMNYITILCIIIGIVYTTIRRKLPIIENYLYQNLKFTRIFIDIIRNSR